MKKPFTNIWLLATGTVMFITMGALAQTPTYQVSTFVTNAYAGGLVIDPIDPFGLDVDSYGNVYLVDASNSILTRTTPGGVMTMLNEQSAGQHPVNGPLNNNHFSSPRGVYINPNTNNMYVINTWLGEISKIAGFNYSAGTGGTVSAVTVYNSTSGNYIGPNLANPYSMCMTPIGDMYVTDADNHRIVLIPAGGGPESTYAGAIGQAGSTNGPGLSARFSHPLGICSWVDGSGVTLYVTDYDNNKVRKIAPNAVVSDVNIGTATLSHPRGIRVDCAGNLYVTDNNGVNKIPAGGGSLTIIAGSTSKTAGYVDGTGNSARFAYPSGIWVNPAGNLIYVAEGFSDITWSSAGYQGSGGGTPPGISIIRKITIPTISIAAVCSSRAYPSPCYDNFPAIYSPNTFPGTSSPCSTVTVPVIDPFSTCPGTPSNSQQFKLKGDFLTNNLVVSAPTGFEVSISPTSGYAGSISFTPSTSNMDNNVSAVTIYVRMSGTGTAGTYSGNITCTSTNAITKTIVIPNSTLVGTCPQIVTQAYHVNTLSGSGKEGNAESCSGAFSANYLYPGGIYMPASGFPLYVADSYNNRIRMLWSSGYTDPYAGTGAIGNLNGSRLTSNFNIPYDMCTDASNNMYIADAESHAIRMFTASTGLVSTLAGSLNSIAGHADNTGTAATFDTPVALCRDGSGNLYVVDKSNHKIRKVTSGGVVTTFAGSSTNQSGFNAGSVSLTTARFFNPTDICINPSNGDLYVTDKDNNAIRKISGGNVTVFAGSTSGTAGYVDAIGNSARFSNLNGITIDATGNLYVSDGDRIRKITPSGLVTTVAGSGTFEFKDGPAASAMFRNPSGLAVDPSGSPIYVADTKNNRIRKIFLQNTTGPYVFATCPGTPSAAQSFVISGTNITTNIAITAPSTYQISLDPNFATTGVTLTPPAGSTTVGATTIYVRMSGTGSGPYPATLTCSTSNQVIKTITLNGSYQNTPFTTIYTTKDHNNYPDQVLSASSNSLNTYTWSPTTNLSNLNTSQSVVFSNSTPGSYNYTVTITNGACSYNLPVSVTVKKQGAYFDSYIDAGIISQSVGNNNPYVNTQNNSTSNGFGNNFGQASDDIFYKFIVTQPSNVVVSHCNSGITDSYLTLFDANRTVIAQNDNQPSGGCGNTNHAYISRNLIPGTYYIASEGAGTNSGSITTKIQAYPLVSGTPGYNTSNPVVIPNLGSCINYNNSDHLGRGFDNVNGNDESEIYYKLVLTSSSQVTMSTLASALTYPSLYLMGSDGITVIRYQTTINGAKPSFTENLAAGTYYIVVEDAFGCPDYITLDVTTAPGFTVTNAISIGTNVGTCFSYSDTENSACYRDINEEDYEEIYYKLTTGPAPVTATFSTCNSAIADPTILLYNQNNLTAAIQVVYDNGASCPSGSLGGSLKAIISNVSLAANTTYIVVVDRAGGAPGNSTLNVTTAGPGCRLAEENVLTGNPVTTEPAFSIYPNPSTGLFNISLNHEQTGILLVTDMMGREISKMELDGSGQYQINLANQPKGIYNMRVSGTKFSKQINLQ